MRNIFSSESGFYKTLMRLTDLMILNALFVIGSLGIVSIGASATALLSVLFKYHDGKEVIVIRDFMDAFKKNFKQSTIVWIILLAFGLMMGFNIFLFGKTGNRFFDVYQILNLLLLILLILVSIIIFPMIARFENTIKNYFMNSIMMLISHPGQTLMIVLSLITVVMISAYNQLMMGIALGFFILIGFSLITLWLLVYIKKMFYQYER